MIPDDWVDEQTLEFFNSADTYYALLLPSLIPALIVFNFFIEFGLEFFINN